MLFWKEIRKTVFSISFAIFIVALIVLPLSQDVLIFSELITEPEPGSDYGIQQKEIPEVIMPAAFASLCEEFAVNEYVAYPIGFYKTIKFNNSRRKKMADIISALSGVPAADLSGYGGDSPADGKMELTVNADENFVRQEDDSFIINQSDVAADTPETGGEIALLDTITYETFKAYMKQADDLIGGGSRYSENNLPDFCYVAVTYEEAAENYHLAADTDKFTGAYARLFCDYIGIILSILPVFIAVAVCLKDERTKMSGLIYARKISSFGLIFIRWFAVIIAVMIPTIVLTYMSNSSIWGQYRGMTLDYLAPLKYAAGWLTPSVMMGAAVGMFFTELTGTPIAIAIQGLWWFIDLNAGIGRLRGIHTLFELTPRHNSLGNTQIFLDEWNTLAANRLIMAFTALLLIFATVIVYEQKRRGRLDGYGKIKNFITGMANRKG